MGQLHSVAVVTADWVWQHATGYRSVTAMTYQQFVHSLGELNNLTQSLGSQGNKQLLFHIRDGTDKSMFWRKKIRIICYKVSSVTGGIESTRVLTLQQYVTVHQAIQQQVSARLHQSMEASGDDSNEACNDAAVIITKIDDICNSGETIDEECVICMDRKAAVILPCYHSYCEQCIETWHGNSNNRSCPSCRAQVRNSDDSWVILSEKPSVRDMADEVMNIFDSMPAVDPDNVDAVLQ